MKRLFFGIRPDEATRDALCETMSRLTFSKGRLQTRDNLHLTLVFLGMMDEAALPALFGAARAAFMTPFELTLSGQIGTFRGGSVVWAGLERSDALSDLRARLRAVLADAGLPQGEADYVPHITLGRGMALSGERPNVARVSFAVNRIELFESVRVEDRLRYLPLSEETRA